MSLTIQDRLNYVVALAIKNRVTPDANSFVQFARNIYISKFKASKQVMKADIDMLVSAWRSDHWRLLVDGSPYFNREETEEWKRTH